MPAEVQGNLLTEMYLSMHSDGTWELLIYADVPGQTPGAIGAGPSKFIEDKGTYTLSPNAQGFTTVNFTSTNFIGWKFAGNTDGQILAFFYDLSSFPGSRFIFYAQLQR